MAVNQNPPAYIRLRIKNRGNLAGLTCEVPGFDSSFTAQGWNARKRGWQPYLLTVYEPEGDTFTLNFDRDVEISRVERIRIG